MKTLADIFALMDAHDELYIREGYMPTIDDLINAEEELGITFGSQLRKVMLSKMLCVGGDTISVCKKVARETQEEWDSYPFTKGYVFFLSQGEWHIYVDSEDYVFLVEVGGNKIEPQKKKLFDWIYDTVEEWYSLG